MKVCRVCDVSKDNREYYKYARNKDGLDSQCKLCSEEYHTRYTKKWIENNREKYLVRRKYDHKKERRADPYLYYARATILHHKKNGRVDLSVNCLLDKINSSPTCSICGIKLTYSLHGGKHWQPEKLVLDRVNNEPFINDKNTWMVCTRCSTSKNNKPMSEFVSECKKILDVNDGLIKP